MHARYSPRFTTVALAPLAWREAGRDGTRRDGKPPIRDGASRSVNVSMRWNDRIVAGVELSRPCPKSG